MIGYQSVAHYLNIAQIESQQHFEKTPRSLHRLTAPYKFLLSVKQGIVSVIIIAPFAQTRKANEKYRCKLLENVLSFPSLLRLNNCLEGLRFHSCNRAS